MVNKLYDQSNPNCRYPVLVIFYFQKRESPVHSELLMGETRYIVILTTPASVPQTLKLV